jgi:hypothetical protein
LLRVQSSEPRRTAIKRESLASSAVHGTALATVHPPPQADVRDLLKQRGARPAKGRCRARTSLR